MDWLWQGIITTFICFLLSKLFYFLKDILSKKYPRLSNRHINAFNHICLINYVCSIVNGFVMFFILSKSNFKHSSKYSILVLLVFCFVNMFLYFSATSIRNNAFKKDCKTYTNKNTNKVK